MLIQPSTLIITLNIDLRFGAEFSDINLLESLYEMFSLVGTDKIIHKVLGCSRCHLKYYTI
jgi:hypothetical protein